MKISFIMNARMPTEKAHGYQIAKMCEAFALTGADVSLMIPTRKNDIDENIFSYFGVRNIFLVMHIPTFDVLSFFSASRSGFYAQSVSFLWALRSAIVPSDTIVITRNPEVVWWYGRKGYQIFYDAHNFPERGTWLLKRLLMNATGIIANSKGTASAFRQNGFKKILTAPNGVDLKQFTETKIPERSALGLPAGRIVMYVGHLYEWKGVDVVVEAAQHLEDKNVTFVFLGGTEKDIAHYREKTQDLDNVLFLGHHQRNEIPAFIKSADVLLLPNVPSTIESISYTSPIKMFEYMASGVPIVASDLPSIREILNKSNSILVEPGNSTELANSIHQALNDHFLAKKISEQALRDVATHTWTKRANDILEFIQS